MRHQYPAFGAMFAIREANMLYQKLKARGMPGHPMLEWQPRGWFKYGTSRIADSDAIALLAMHALFWLSNLRSDKPRIYKPTIQMAWYEHDDHMMFDFIGIKQDTDTMIWSGSTHRAQFIDSVLQCVVNSTAHLEPAA